MDRFQPSTQNPDVPPPVNLDPEEDGNRAPDHEPVIGGDDAQLPIPGKVKQQVAPPDPQGVRDAQRKGLGMPASKSEDAGA